MSDGKIEGLSSILRVVTNVFALIRRLPKKRTGSLQGPFLVLQEKVLPRIHL